jgi:hypothetical protein
VLNTPNWALSVSMLLFMATWNARHQAAPQLPAPPITMSRKA